MKSYLKELLNRKDLLLYLVKSGLKAEHRNSYLGYFWWLLDPLLNVLVYYFVVVIVLGRGGPNYATYLVIGSAIMISVTVGNNQEMSWSLEDVNARLETKLTDAYQQCVAFQRSHDGLSLREAGFALAVARVVEAAELRGYL